MTALSIAQDAVALSRLMLEQIIDSSSGSLSSVDESNVDWSLGAIFALARTLSSLDCHLESYVTWKEGFQTFVRLPVLFLGCPSGKDIDSFLNQICTVAEGGGFSLAMLVDCVILCCNLARIYPEQFSRRFLWILHAYAYFTQQDDSPLIDIRLFLEPNSDCPLPKLDVARPMDIGLGRDGGIQIEDVVWAFFTFPSQPSDHLIQNIFITHFNETIVVLQDIVEKSYSNTITIKWVFHTINNIFLLISTPNQLALLQGLTGTINHFGAILASRESDWEWVLDHLFDPIFRNLWRTGLLNGALEVCRQVIKYLDSRFQSDDVTVAAGYWRLNHHFILCDMGRYSDAIGLVQQATIASVPEGFFLHPYIVQIRILRRTGRNQEALQLLRKGVATGCRKYWTVDVQVFDLGLDFLFSEFATTWGYIGNRERALKNAERAVTACRKDIGPDEDIEYQKCILVHSLVTVSGCLATLGRNDEALAAAHEAVLVYTENVPHMWGKFLYKIRKQELGANAFHMLSLRLAPSGKAQQALQNAEIATELYRELVGLAPRHLPTLASSLQNLGSILWDVGRRDEAIATCKEAVGIMRKVSSSETYFLPTLAEALEQLAGYLGEKGDVGGASAAAAESAEVQREFAVLPPEPEFLFEKVVDMMESDDEWETSAPAHVSEADDKYHNTSEGPSVEAVESDDKADKYHDASEPPTSIEPLALISELPSRSSTSTPGPATDIDTPVKANLAGDSATVMGLDASSTLAVQNPTATDTAKSILSQPLEVNVKLRLRSTLMDVVWWVILVLGISFAIAWRRVV
jgi:tetratricopeptide (TPR) repeat protein